MGFDLRAIGGMVSAMRRLFSLALLGLISAATPVAGADQRPNLLLIVVDDMGWMDSTVYGSQYYETPNFERLAARGMVFWNAYSANPLCSPSRASLLTGQYPARHGITSAVGHTPPDPPNTPRYPERVSPGSRLLQPRPNRFLDPAIVTMAEVLREAGYRTAHLGKWHLGLNPEHWPEAQGFETVFHGAPDPGPPSYHSPYGFKAGTIKDGPPGEYITDRLASEAVEFIETHRDEAWYLNLWQFGVHGPWGHQEAYTKAFAKKTDPRGAQKNPIMASMLKSVDESIGRVLDTLDRLNLTDNTLVILTSDNGGNVHSNTANDVKISGAKPGDRRWPMIEGWRKWAGTEPPTNNAPLRDGKSTLYEGGVRVPLIVSWPGGKVPKASDTMAFASGIDVFPTVLDAFGLKAPTNQPIDGISLLPVLRGEEETTKRDTLFNYFPHGGPAKPPGVTVRRGDWKLIRWFETGPEHPEPIELYHLRDDIGESTNVAKWHPDEVAALNGLIDQFIADTGATPPKPNPAYRESSVGNAPVPDDPLLGWVPKSATAERGPNGLTVTPAAKGRAFIAITRLAALKHTGPMRVTIDFAKSAAGEGSAQWRTADQDVFPESGQRTSFSVADSAESASADLPIDGKLAHLRLFLPGAAVIREIRFEKDDGETLMRWRFRTEK